MVSIDNASIEVDGQSAKLGLTVKGTIGLVTKIRGVRFAGVVRVEGDGVVFGDGRFWPAGQIQSVGAQFSLAVDEALRSVDFSVFDGANELLNTGEQVIRSGVISVE